MIAAWLFGCRDPRGAHWQLGPLPPAVGSVTLIGWRISIPSLDDGVPQTIAICLSRALTSIARVTFLCSAIEAQATAQWSEVGNDAVCVLNHGHFSRRVAATLGRQSARAVLLSTRLPETAMRLFYDAGYPWWLQGQVVLLSATDAPPPKINCRMVDSLFANDWTENASVLASLGIHGILRPGVDGDLAGLLSFTFGFEHDIMTELKLGAQSFGLNWAELSEDAFAQRLGRG